MVRNILTLSLCCAFFTMGLSWAQDPPEPGNDISLRLIENRPPCDIAPGESIIELVNHNSTTDYKVEIIATAKADCDFMCAGAGPDCEVTWNTTEEVLKDSCYVSTKPMPSQGCLPGECSALPGGPTTGVYCSKDADCLSGEFCDDIACQTGTCSDTTPPKVCTSDSNCTGQTNVCVHLRGSGCDNCKNACLSTSAGKCVEFVSHSINVVYQRVNGGNWDPVNPPSPVSGNLPLFPLNCCTLGFCPIQPLTNCAGG